MERWLWLSYGAWIGGNKVGGLQYREAVGVGLWEREEVWEGEMPRTPSEPSLGLAGCSVGREGEILDKAPGWGG